jgi:hypothetical protein
MQSVALPTSTGEVRSGHHGRFSGYQIRETSGSAAATVVFTSVGSTGGNAPTVLASVEIPSGTSVDVIYPVGAFEPFYGGVVVTITGSGTITGFMRYV